MYGYAQDIDLIQDGQLSEVRMHGRLISPPLCSQDAMTLPVQALGKTSLVSLSKLDEIRVKADT